MTKKRFHVELYGDDDFLKEDWSFETKAEQLAKYYTLISEGYKRKNITKFTMLWYL